MALRRSIPLTISPLGVSDSIDATNSSRGVMASLQNLVPALHTERTWVPRPAAAQFAAFAGFTGPAGIECVFVQQTRIFGLVASTRFAGKSEPFCYDRATNAYITIQGVNSGNCPVTQPTTGDWTPPTMQLFGGRIICTHIGFSLIGVPPPPIPNTMLGWFDMTGFLDATGKLGTVTSGSNLITGMSANTLQAGWRPGQQIQDSLGAFPVGARIVAVSLDGLTVTVDNAATQTGIATLTVVGGNRLAPLWSAGNINGFNLLVPPLAVAQFAGSAFYAVNNGVVFSDPGDPLSITNAFGVQAISFQDGGNVTALAGLPLNSLQGGIIQSMMCFQGAVQIQQISGSFPTSALSPSFVVNKLNVSTGTVAQNSIATTSRGLAFISPDGMRLIDFQANVSGPIGAYGRGVSLPFRFAINPTRMCAACNGDVYRVSVTTPIAGASVITTSVSTQEFWFHIPKDAQQPMETGFWSGPHTFPAAVIAADQTTLGFVLAANGINAKLWLSDTLPGPSSSYVENGAALSWTAQTSRLPDNAEMMGNSIVETALFLGIKPGDSVTVQFIDDNGVTLDSVAIPAAALGSGIWGTAIWGGFLWGAPASVQKQYRVNWNKVLVFKQGQLLITGNSAPGVVVGNMYLRTEIGFHLRAA